MRLLALLLILIGWAGSADAGTVVSRDVSDVSVTVYRAPGRGKGAMDRNWPRGYALISETRTITIPAGESVIRFEGVAEGLLPETAIVTGLPSGVREKNRDARLVSPAGLVDAFLKRRVMLKRTNRKTGAVVEQEAIIQAGPNGGVILRTAQGVEALGCSGLPERMLYPEVPEDLSPRPTLSVLTTSDRVVTATIQLTYMAQGFDWSAAYVARTADAPGKIGLFAWLTIANGGVQGFPNARLQVVAGQPNKVSNAPPLARPSPVLRLQCWPMDITSTHPRYVFSRIPWPLDIVEDMDASSAEIVVSASRRGGRSYAMSAPPPPPPPPPPPAPVGMVAQQEELGDLKLYRVPERVNVAAQAQKQVAMIDQSGAAFDRVYSANMVSPNAIYRPMPFLLRSKNSKEKGLGLPLPAGEVAIFEQLGTRELLVGTVDLADLAVDERVELSIGSSPDVQWKATLVKSSKKKQDWRIDISNARDVAIKAEVIVPGTLADKPPGTERGRGGWVLPVTVAENGTAELRYSLKLKD